MAPEKIQRLELTKKALDELAAEIEKGRYPVTMLEDFKESVDHARTTIWMMVKLEEEQRAAQSGQAFELEQKLIEYRVRRAQWSLKQIEADIDTSGIEIHTQGILDFAATVTSLNDRLGRLLQSGR